MKRINFEESYEILEKYSLYNEAYFLLWNIMKKKLFKYLFGLKYKFDSTENALKILHNTIHENGDLLSKIPFCYEIAILVECDETFSLKEKQYLELKMIVQSLLQILDGKAERGI